MRELGFATRAIHVGQEPDPTTGAVIPPICLSSTFAQESPGKHKGFVYARVTNPTRESFEQCIASLEGGSSGYAFASGLAAQTAILDMLPKDSHVISCDDLYGGTYRMFEQVRKPACGLQVSYVDMTKPQVIENAITPQTKLLWVETPTNPLLKLVDLEMLADIGKKNGLITVCDNTFASPYLQQPLRYGFDIVFHSSTKYINGHSDVINGVAVVGEKKEYGERLKFFQKAVGAIPGPFDCYLAHRGVKTLALRMERHCDNAERLAELLATQPSIERVMFPGLTTHPQYALARKQMRRAGGMISVILKGGLEQSRHLLERVKLFALAESLGGVESLIQHPAIMTHASVPAEERKRMGLVDGLVRISVGIEDYDDLKEDLLQALPK